MTQDESHALIGEEAVELLYALLQAGLIPDDYSLLVRSIVDRAIAAEMLYPDPEVSIA